MTRKRIDFITDLLAFAGIEPERLRLDWVSSSEGVKFAQVMNEFSDTIKSLGPSPLRPAPLVPAAGTDAKPSATGA